MERGRQADSTEVDRSWEVGWTGVECGWCVCVCVDVTDSTASPQGALQGAIDKDSLGKFLSLVLRHSSVIQPCQVTS